MIFVLVVILSTLLGQGEAFHAGTGGLGKKRGLNGCVEVKFISLPYGKVVFLLLWTKKLARITLHDLLQELAIDQEDILEA